MYEVSAAAWTIHDIKILAEKFLINTGVQKCIRKSMKSKGWVAPFNGLQLDSQGARVCLDTLETRGRTVRF